MRHTLNRLPLHEELRKYLFVLIGSSLLATGVTMFLVPNQIVSGGTPGAAILLNYFTQVPIGNLMLYINIPLLLISLRFIGKGFAVRTVFAIFVTAMMVNLLHTYLKLDGWTHEPILGAVFGGVFIGLGLGFIIIGNASAGGPSIVARIIAQKTHLKESHLIIFLDAAIVVAAGFVYSSIESALWSLIGVYVSAKSLDILITGRPTKKIVQISTRHAETLSHHIMNGLENDGIVLSGVGFDLLRERKLLMLVVDNNKIQAVKDIIKEHDEDGFMIVMDAAELHGRGH